ncbi:MAG: hypothetical protein WCP32_14115 [Bacteroidota bacterium]
MQPHISRKKIRWGTPHTEKPAKNRFNAPDFSPGISGKFLPPPGFSLKETFQEETRYSFLAKANIGNLLPLHSD